MPIAAQVFCWEACCDSCDSVSRITDFVFLHFILLPLLIFSFMHCDVSPNYGFGVHPFSCCSNLCLLCVSNSGRRGLQIPIWVCGLSLSAPPPAPQAKTFSRDPKQSPVTPRTPALPPKTGKWESKVFSQEGWPTNMHAFFNSTRTKPVTPKLGLVLKSPTRSELLLPLRCVSVQNQLKCKSLRNLHCFVKEQIPKNKGWP